VSSFKDATKIRKFISPSLLTPFFFRGRERSYRYNPYSVFYIDMVIRSSFHEKIFF